jgi:prepilin-type N-terminal cleavage/methylation domain-containing protein
MKTDHSGFTLIEVMAALSIVAVTFAIIMSFESYLMTTTKRGSNRIERTWAMTNYLYECHGKSMDELEKDPTKKLTKKITNPELMLTYQQKPIAQSSNLNKLDNLVLETVDAEWKNQQGTSRKDNVINIRFMIKKETKNKEQAQ